jgi:hypothetical protein
MQLSPSNSWNKFFINSMYKCPVLQTPLALHGHLSTVHPAWYSFVSLSKNSNGANCGDGGGNPSTFALHLPQNSLPDSRPQPSHFVMELTAMYQICKFMV